MKYGILLVNLGSPTAPTPKAVRKYLAQFLGDRHVIELSPLLWKPILHGIVLRTRPAKSARNYAKIWGKDADGKYDQYSSLVDITFKQADALQKLMPENFCVKVGMRYGHPSIETGLCALRDANCEKILIIPLYPQHSRATTESVCQVVKTIQKNQRGLPKIILSPSYFKHSDYISSIADTLESHLEGLSWQADEILVSFHGLPRSSIDKGDPYEKECQETYRLLKKKLPHLAQQLTLTYQSRFGPKEWLGPYTQTVLSKAAQSGRKNIVIVAPGFAADCLETLEELSITAKSIFMEQGGMNLSVAPCLNVDPTHINLLAKIANAHLNTNG